MHDVLMRLLFMMLILFLARRMQCLLNYLRSFSMQVSKESEQIRISGLNTSFVAAQHGSSLLLEVLSRTDNRDGPMLIFVSHYGPVSYTHLTLPTKRIV